MSDSTSDGGRLLAILLNPPSETSGLRTRNVVDRAARVLGYDGVQLANLCRGASRSVDDLSLLNVHHWSDARQTLAELVPRCDAILAAWGVSGLVGRAREQARDQTRWLVETMAGEGISEVWALGGQPRHPSRWHQYLSDRHGRTTGGSFDERLEQALERVPLSRIGGPS